MYASIEHKWIIFVSLSDEDPLYVGLQMSYLAHDAPLPTIAYTAF